MIFIYSFFYLATVRLSLASLAAYNCQSLPWFLQNEATKSIATPHGWHLREVLRYISDGDVQSPLLGLKFAI